MGTTQTLRTALVNDLNAIDGTGSFNTSLGEVSREPKPFSETSKPAAVIIDGPGGVAELLTLSNDKGEANQEFVVELHLISQTPNQGMDDLLSDVRNAVERSTGNLLTSSGVITATVTEWDELTPEGTQEYGYIRRATVNVLYDYTRGSL